MINVVIEPQSDILTMNAQIAESASVGDMRAAWQEVASGLLQRHIRDAIGFECVKRGIDPRDVICEPLPMS